MDYGSLCYHFAMRVNVFIGNDMRANSRIQRQSKRLFAVTLHTKPQELMGCHK